MHVPSKSTKILIVDDMLAFRKVLKSQLAALGFKKVKEAIDGQQAWDLINKEIGSDEPFEVIICDWCMPNLTGIELLERVRETEGMKDIPFIMLTAEKELTQVTRAIKSGCSEYIVKPFSGDQVQLKLQTVLKSFN